MTTTVPLSVPTEPALTVRPLSLARTVGAEARKLINTRTGPLLIGLAALLVGAFAGGVALLPSDLVLTLGLLGDMAAMPASSITTVLAVLLVAGEYTARTASMTFTLDPSRGRVLSGKAIVVLALALVASALSYLAAASVAAVAPLVSGRPIAWTADPAGVGIVVGSVVFSAMAGYALALAFRNAVAPILLLLVWPTVALLIGALSPTLKEPLGYLDVDPVFGLMDGASNPVVKLLVSALVWVALPVVVGAWRTLNRDVE
jgi:hypothetical protein